MSRLLTVTALLVLCKFSVFAQLTGRVTGTIVDPSGASVPDAKVSLHLTGSTSAMLTSKTNADGIFDFIAVRPDVYNLEVESAGFAKFTLGDVKVDPVR